MEPMRQSDNRMRFIITNYSWQYLEIEIKHLVSLQLMLCNSQNSPGNISNQFSYRSLVYNFISNSLKMICSIILVEIYNKLLNNLP